MKPSSNAFSHQQVLQCLLALRRIIMKEPLGRDIVVAALSGSGATGSEQSDIFRLLATTRKDSVLKISSVLPDQYEGHIETRTATVNFDPVGISVQFDDYGDATSQDGYGVPLLLEVYDSELRAIIWSNISEEDPTHKISLEGAKEIDRPKDQGE
jgi:hypothetical protein